MRESSKILLLLIFFFIISCSNNSRIEESNLELTKRIKLNNKVLQNEVESAINLLQTEFEKNSEIFAMSLFHKSDSLFTFYENETLEDSIHTMTSFNKLIELVSIEINNVFLKKRFAPIEYQSEFEVRDNYNWSQAEYLNHYLLFKYKIMNLLLSLIPLDCSFPTMKDFIEVISLKEDSTESKILTFKMYHAYHSDYYLKDISITNTNAVVKKISNKTYKLMNSSNEQVYIKGIYKYYNGFGELITNPFYENIVESQ